MQGDTTNGIVKQKAISVETRIYLTSLIQLRIDVSIQKPEIDILVFTVIKPVHHWFIPN